MTTRRSQPARNWLAATLLGSGLNACAGTGPAATYVIHVSVDGLRPDAVVALGATNAPNFYRMRSEAFLSGGMRLSPRARSGG